ncbi:MAG: sigma 54-interacting transcriptional regulator [Rhizobacter sp.]
MTDLDSDNEAVRLAALESYGVLGTPSEPAYDDLARLAAQICGTPMSLVSFVDAHRQWFKARVGLSLDETPRAESICAAAIRQRDLLVVPDASVDPRFAHLSLVTGAPHIRFYAGMPLIEPGGEALGTLCVIDRVPRRLTDEQVLALRTLASQVVSLLALRRTQADAARAATQWLESERALREREQFMTRLIEGSQDCIKVLDLDGQLLTMNEGGMRVMEVCDFEPLRNQPWHALWPAESQETVRAAVAMARSGGVGRFAGFCPTAAGTPRWWDVAVSAIVDERGQPDRLLAVSRDITDRHRAEELLRAITEGTATSTGTAFFASLVRHLARALGVWRVFVAECLDGDRARARAVWLGDGHAPLFEYALTGTPCQKVVEGETCLWARDVQQSFPDNQFMKQVGLQSYLGVPMFDSERRVVGHMVVTDRKPMPEDPLWISVLQIFAARAGAELEREHADERLRTALGEVERLKNQLQAENVYLQEEIRREHDFEEMVGNSPALLALLQQVELVARTDATVLIQGETGTGKELIARALHNSGPRRARPLVKVNCGAIPANLIESELLGHVKGAFTGAIDRRIGRIELANHGTLFLDEIGELPLDTQVKLLRVLQEQEFEPLGSNKTVHVDVRIIAATNRDLHQEVKGGRFRADLFFRLNVVPLFMPALRERAEDIPLLLMYFVSRLSKKFGRDVQGVTRDTMARLVRYEWPGNVRELQNVVERAVVLARGPMLSLGDDLLPASRALPTPAKAHDLQAAAFSENRELGSLEDAERQHIEYVLSQTRGVIEGTAGAAHILKLHPNTLRSRMKKLGITRRVHDIS